jgi:hypothetical protein
MAARPRASTARGGARACLAGSPRTGAPLGAFGPDRTDGLAVTGRGLAAAGASIRAGLLSARVAFSLYRSRCVSP